jgi:hypothetical protein
MVMNRSAFAVLAFVIGLLVAFVWLQQTQVKPLREQVASLEKENTDLKARLASTAQWETLSDGTKVLRIWEKAGPRWPETTLLDISNEQYRKFQQDPLKFVNGLPKPGIVSKDVEVNAHNIELQAAPEGYQGRWLLFIGHTWTTSQYSASLLADEVHTTHFK